MLRHTKDRIGLFRDNRGQAMTEFCVAMPALVVMFWAIWYITDVYVVKFNTQVAARYGTWLLARNHDVQKTNVDTFIARRFFDSDSSQLTITAQHRGSDSAEGNTSSFQDSAQENSDSNEWVDRIINFIGSAFMGSDSPSMHSLKVECEVPLIFGALNVTEYAVDNAKITSEHYVVGNTWNGCQSDVHDMFDMIQSILGDLVDMIVGGGDADYGEGKP